jgi:hypothetical protein
MSQRSETAVSTVKNGYPSTVRNGYPSTVSNGCPSTVILSMIGRSIRHTFVAYSAPAGMFGPLSRVLFERVKVRNERFKIEALIYLSSSAGIRLWWPSPLCRHVLGNPFFPHAHFNIDLHVPQESQAFSWLCRGPLHLVSGFGGHPLLS